MVAYNQNQGMNPVKSFADHPYSANFLWYPIASGYNTNIFVGSPVTVATNSGTITIGATNDRILGSARAFKDFTTGGTGIVAPSANQGVIPTTIQQYWVRNTIKPTGVQTYVAVQVDINTLYNMQSNPIDMPTGFPVTSLFDGANFSIQPNFSAGDGNISTGYSTAEIRQLITTPAATTNFQVISLSPNNGNAWSTINNNVLVKINASICYPSLTI
jgi:hypothetical protein